MYRSLVADVDTEFTSTNSIRNSKSHVQSSCSCSCSNKRRALDSPVQLEENRKKQNTINLLGFSKFTLASTYSTQDFQSPSLSTPRTLRRCLFDPYKPSLSVGKQIPVTQSLESAKIDCLMTLASKRTTASMPPCPTTQRCLSDSLTDKCFSRSSSAKDTSVAENSDTRATRGEEPDSEELVSVDRHGDCFIIHFKCSCRKGFDIPLRGDEF